MSQPIPREVEVKLAVPSAESAREMLRRAGFTESIPRSFESNAVFDTPTGTLFQGRRLLRLRDFRNQAIVTFKGPPDPGPHKSRPEIETLVADPAAFQLILLGIGYEVVFRYEKFRTTYQQAEQPGHAVLDETPIGVYLELEGPAAWIDSTATLLGFEPSQYVLRSYAALYQEYRARTAAASPHLVFVPGEE
jgi:adenylate cyclase class 2